MILNKFYLYLQNNIIRNKLKYLNNRIEKRYEFMAKKDQESSWNSKRFKTPKKNEEKEVPEIKK